MHRLRRLFQKTKSESQLHAELQFHLERQIADYIASGMTAAEARRVANGFHIVELPPGLADRKHRGR